MNLEMIIAAAQDGDIAAQNQLAVVLNELLRGFISHMARGSSLEVEDLCQKVCVVVFEHLHEFEHRGPGSFGRWAREIARRRVREGWRNQAREAAGLAAFAHHPRESTLSPVSRVTRHELGEQLDSVFEGLSELEREAILWNWGQRDETRADAELAEKFDTTVNAIQVSRSRGLKKLATQTQKMRKTPLPRLERATKRASSSSQQVV